VYLTGLEVLLMLTKLSKVVNKPYFVYVIDHIIVTEKKMCIILVNNTSAPKATRA